MLGAGGAWGREGLGQEEGWRWESRWRSESQLEASPRGPVCLVTNLAQTWKNFFSESWKGRSKIQGISAFKYCKGQGEEKRLTQRSHMDFFGGWDLLSRLRG